MTAERQSRTSSNPAGATSLALIDQARFAEVGSRAFAGAPPARTASLLFLAAFPLSVAASLILLLCWVVFSVALGIFVGRVIRFGQRPYPRGDELDLPLPPLRGFEP